MAKKRWLRISKTISKQRRDAELASNQWGSKQLFEELFRGDVTDRSELYLYQRQERPDGIIYTPKRVTVNDLLSAELNILDEGNAFSTYLPSQIFDEVDAAQTYTSEEIYEEGDAETIYSPINSFGI